MALLNKLALRNEIKVEELYNYNDEEGVRLECHGGVVLRITCGHIDFSTYTPDDFSFFLVKTKQNGESDFDEIKFRGDRIGWVFPLLSFNNRTQFTSKWANIYSNFALYALTQDDLISEQANMPEMSRTEWNLIDFFDESTAILVFGKEALARLGIDSEKAVFSLIQNYYCPMAKVGPAASLFERLHRRDEKGNISKLSSIGTSDLERLQFLINEAISSIDPCSCFLLLYQNIEYLLSQVFEIAVKVFCRDESMSRNPWELKDRLNESTKELWRLERITNDFLSQPIDPAISSMLLDVCSRFLVDNELILTKEAPNSVAKGIYAVRNVLIHRQIEMSVEVREKVFDINALFLLFVIELLIKFDKNNGESKIIEHLLAKQSELV